jgi:predicted transcriptional regulator YheO
MWFSSTRLKECESERRKQLEQVRKLLEEIKEYSMKIIEVVLHQTESDEEDEILVLKKRIQTMR